MFCSLSEDPNVKVGVIEAGEWLPDLPNINVPGTYLCSARSGGRRTWLSVVLYRVGRHDCRKSEVRLGLHERPAEGREWASDLSTSVSALFQYVQSCWGIDRMYRGKVLGGSAAVRRV